MLTGHLIKSILIEPVKKGADSLFIVSGFASPTMASKHIELIEEKLKTHINISLLIGMCPDGGLPLKDHISFIQLSQSLSKNQFRCSYLYDPPAVHSKVYIWCKENTPVYAFCGSANYTQTGFSECQLEVMQPCDPKEALGYYNFLEGKSIYCTHGEVDNYIKFYIPERTPKNYSTDEEKESMYTLSDVSAFPRVTVSFLERGGDLPKRSGLNWGQRPEVGREPNQAYIRLPSSIYKTNFFPPRPVHFTVLTDDKKSIICARAQDNGKAIHSTLNNSLLGEYFRNRLGLPNGAEVRKEDLVRYGRTDVDFYKIDEETYFMDFSVQ
ncbi:MAG: NgoFVII family restriction endonuclease [Ignavibacteria bacterium]|jgi:hypothetical protein|nr:NgoFVII family restriction endonuclease [Ignavibacteria bacterium]MCU7521210.1 NgoFVII family restriction endonuclease [Ignavibacteria bacterium]